MTKNEFTDSNKNPKDRIVLKEGKFEEILPAVQRIATEGWNKVTLSGSKEMRRLAWLDAKLAGLQVEGYLPSVRDQNQLELMRQEQNSKQTVSGHLSALYPASRIKSYNLLQNVIFGGKIMNTQERLEREIFWKEVVNRFNSSGLSGKRFSVQESISEAQLWYWQRKFKGDSLRGFELVKAPRSKESNFVEIETPLNQIPEESEIKSNSQVLELSLPHGIVLKMWS